MSHARNNHKEAAILTAQLPAIGSESQRAAQTGTPVCEGLVRIYECLCDETRLRIVQMLMRGPLCVCHLQAVLDVPQARVSQHLAYLRERGMVACHRRGTWMIYSLPEKPTRELAKHLACLQDCAVSDKRFREDLRKLKSLNGQCEPPAKLTGSRRK